MGNPAPTSVCRSRGTGERLQLGNLGDPVTSLAGDLEPELGWWEVIDGGVAGKGSLSFDFSE